ncbi:hypothetical protein DWF04_022740 [Cereibacter sphaeroides f. sp. denitrificans]|nr:hypothetical protein DWF04_15415 [Cereibacter sphaeroides f. sp. denitrificans]
MATITPTLMTGPGQRAMVETTLTSSNVFVYAPGTGQILILRNATAGALTPVIDGDGGTTFPVPGIGNVDVSGGYSVGSVAAGAVRAIPLDTISAYLQGAINISGATGMVASLLNF